MGTSPRNSNGETPSTMPTRDGKRILGVDFAPLDVPLDRRLQTLAVASWILTFFLMGPGSLLFLLYLFFYSPQLRCIPILYLFWYLFDRDQCNQGGRKSDWVRRWRLWSWYCNFFPIKLVKTAPLDPKKNYIFCSHPHGILCSAAFGNFATEGTNFSQKFPGITSHLLTLEGHYSFPFYREYLMSSGACSASRRSLDYLLSRPEGGHAAVLVVGGAGESLESKPGSTYVLKLKERKGFIKAALRHGASLVPIFSFGEIEIYNQVQFPPGRRKRLQNRLQHVLGLAPCLFNGRGIFQYTIGILPQRRPLTTVVGSPIVVEKNPNPTLEEIQQLHTKYVEDLKKLFYDHRHIYATLDSEIVII